ncbi:hypothetical protein AB0M39_38320 [Streptomyces sp. NPDC051907]|uniref:hypothetical protein n=1 Tax=Streptomyces sp. NPDC051907 TaxID=3155284 RepID=UPI0034179A14
MWEGYADLAGQEIINSARAIAYAGNAGLRIDCEPCDSLTTALDDMPYMSPVDADNEAPWYDPAQPQSGQFLGVLGLGVTGFQANPIARSPSALIGDGSALGVLRRTHREVAYTVLLVAQNDAALSYGLEWLATALRGGACTSATCRGDQLCMFSACPGETLGGGDDGDTELRHLFDVGLLEGPTVNQTQYSSTGLVMATTTFTLAAGKPWIFREPLVTLTDWVALSSGDRLTAFDPDTVYTQCPQPKPCLADPTCADPPLPPAPPVPISPCYPKGKGNFYRSRLSLSPLDVPEWLETVPIIEVRTGSKAMRRLTVRFWANPQGLECDQVTDPCSACLDISIGYLPAGSTLTVDGRIQRATVNCPSGTAGSSTSTPTIYGPQGRTFEWPVFTCPTGLCIEVLSKYEDTALNAQARVTLHPRSDAG